MIESFLHSASLAHNQPTKSKDWFLWKFRDNPFGETILACVEEEGVIVGCVAYGIQNFKHNDISIKGSFAFENFVHPKYQRQGIFKKLIALLENEALLKKLDFLMVFPNTNSLQGYLKMNWEQIETIEYYIKARNMIGLFFNFFELKMGFNPSLPNFEKQSIPKSFNQITGKNMQSQITIDYLRWRFFTFPNTEYHYIENSIYDAICRVGQRGRLKEAQVLFVNIKKSKQFKLAILQNEFQEKTNYDIISFPISNTNSLRKKLKKNLFIKVPNSTNVCFKILNGTIAKEDIQQVSLSAINFHTY